MSEVDGENLFAFTNIFLQESFTMSFCEEFIELRHDMQKLQYLFDK